MAERPVSMCYTIGTNSNYVAFYCPSREDGDKLYNATKRFDGWICRVETRYHENRCMVVCEYDPIQQFDGHHLVMELEKEGIILTPLAGMARIEMERKGEN